jgi:hypothetical protein
VIRLCTIFLAGAACSLAIAGTSRWARNEKLEIRRVEILTADPACWKRVDLRVDLAATYKTPFDPDEIAVDAEFSLPSGRLMTVPGFFYQAFTRAQAGGADAVTASGEPEWNIRFMPPEAGTYSVKVVARDHSGSVTSPAIRFEAHPGGGHGYLRVSERDPHYFEFQDGTPFFAIGENMASGSLDDFRRWISALGTHGGNYGRIWIGNPSLGLEYGPLGEYRLDNAWRLDQVMQFSEQYGVYQKLCLDWVRHITPPPPPEQRPANFSLPDFAYREDYAYRTANGGPCETMRDIFTNPEARRLFKARIRYIVARWGYSPNVMGWELWNEMNAIDARAGRPEIVIPWNQEMNRYFKLVDPYRHMTTNSLGGYWPELWALPENEFAQVHGYYGWHQAEDEYNARDMFLFMSKRLAQIQNYKKPYLFAEFGVMFNRPLIEGLPRDPDGVHLHNGLWTPMVFGAAGTGQSWFWRMVDTNNWYGHFQALANFAKDISWTTEGFRKLGVEASSRDLHVLGLLGRNLAIIWVENANHTWWNAVHSTPVRPIENASLEVAGFTHSRYRVEVWDTYEGRILKSAELEAQKGFIRIPLPAVEKDLAIKLIVADGGSTGGNRGF